MLGQPAKTDFFHFEGLLCLSLGQNVKIQSLGQNVSNVKIQTKNS